MVQKKNRSAKPRQPEILPDVAVDPHRSILGEPLAGTGEDGSGQKKKALDKDRLESRPEGTLPTTLDPSSQEARGNPPDPKTRKPENDLDYTA